MENSWWETWQTQGGRFFISLEQLILNLQHIKDYSCPVRINMLCSKQILVYKWVVCTLHLYINVLFPSLRAPQDQIHPRDGGSYPRDDASPRDWVAKGHHRHLLWHDAVRVPLHMQLPAGACSEIWQSMRTVRKWLHEKSYVLVWETVKQKKKKSFHSHKLICNSANLILLCSDYQQSR